MKNNKILYISIAILVLAVGIAFGTYAYYQTTISGTISGNVAKWSFTANGETSSFNLDLGDVYPGKSGTYYIELSAENSELDVYYELRNDGVDYYTSWKNYLSWDLNDEHTYGIYGTIPAGSKISVPIYLNWPYGEYAEEYYGNTTPQVITIIAQQLTGYTGSTPMYLLPECTCDYNNGYIDWMGK